MKIIRIFYIIGCFLLGFTSIFNSKPMVILYLQQIPKIAIFQQNKETSADFASKKLEKIVQQNPSKMSKAIFKNYLKSYNPPSLAGFLVTYAGYMDYSKASGLISFPLSHAPANKLYILISSKVSLVPVRGETFAFEEIDSNNPLDSKMYEFNKNKDIKENLFWRVDQVKLPENNQVSPITLVIHTKPENIFVQTGEFFTSKSAHVILPDNIYILGNQNNIKSLIKFLEQAAYYEPIRYKQASPKETIPQTIMENE